MRYLGSKEKLTSEIVGLLREKNLLTERLVFFDAFCGTGSVANSVKDIYSVIINDMMKWSVIYSYGRIVGEACKFEKLGFDPFSYLNSSEEFHEGFFYKNYSQGGSERMYFTSQNAGRIDYFRSQIEEWKEEDKLNQDEYSYLIACLIESVSSVSNTAGVYGAFLKHWDNRANKTISIAPITSTLFPTTTQIKTYCTKLEDIISDVQCDILYLDPPYTQNQYGTQYHLLETLVVNDNPTISKITGSRPVTPMKSMWSKENHVNVLFDKVVADTQARYIMMSYNNDGLMSKDFIEATLKRYGKADTYECREISYKKYNNSKCHGRDGHLEYLFFIEKKDRTDVLYESPLNYSGSKAKMVDYIKAHLPQDIDTFLDVFGGGFNVGININARRVIYNDINGFVVNLIQSFYTYESYEFLDYIHRQIKKYDLDKEGKEGYLDLRKTYNSMSESQKDPRMLYTLVLFGFQQQVRFNMSHEFNVPYGSRRFNDNLISKLVSFSRHIKRMNVEFINKNFRELLPSTECLTKTYLYLDPPYRETRATYNDGRRGFEGWGIKQEEELCEFLNRATEMGARFMLSYVLDVKDFHNVEVENWALTHHYRIISVDDTQGRYNNRKEVLIINY